MQLLTMNEIKAYMHCPYYYRFRYPKNTPLLAIRAKEHWSNCLKLTIIDSMKAYKSTGNISIQGMQDLWNRYWYEDPMAVTFTDKQTRTGFGNEGWLTLCKFHRLATETETYIAAIEQSYKLEVAKNIYVTGIIDILLHTANPTISKNYLAIKLVDSNYNASNMVGHNDIEMTAYRRAIRKLMAHEDGRLIVEPRLAYFILDPNGEGLIETKRYNEQNEILDETVMAITKSIQTANYYPHFGNWCNQCDYKPLCNKGKWVEKNPSDLTFTKRLKGV